LLRYDQINESAERERVYFYLKHGSGFLMAPTKVSFPLNPSGEIVPYNYTVDYSPMKGRDVLGEFVKSCEKRQIKTGFYYSVVSNSYLHFDNGVVSRFHFCL